MNDARGITFLGALQMLLIALQLMGYIDWPIGWLFAPLFIELGVTLVILLVWLIAYLLGF